MQFKEKLTLKVGQHCDKPTAPASHHIYESTFPKPAHSIYDRSHASTETEHKYHGTSRGNPPCQ